MKFNPGRLCAFFIAVILSQAASAALSVVFQGDFETGQHKATGPSGQIYSYWTSSTPAPDANGDCAAVGGATPSASNAIVTSPVYEGTYANSQTIYWECDYRAVNGTATTGLQKPRNETGGTFSGVGDMVLGKTYWFTYSIYIPEGHTTDSSSVKLNLFQTHKTGTHDTISLVSVGEYLVSGVPKMGLDITNITTGGVFSSAAVTKATWNATQGEWHTFLVNFKPCASGSDSCGFLNVYLSNEARRTAGTEKTAIYAGVGRNLEAADTKVHMTANVYKPAWHCTSSLQSNYASCMDEPPESGTLTYNAMAGKADPITIVFDNLVLAEAADTDDIDDAIAAIAPNFSSSPSAPATPSLVQVNGGNPIEQNDYNYFTTDTSTLGAWGVYDVSLSDSVGTAEEADAWASNATGGCFTTGGLSTLTGGSGTVTMTYDSPGIDSARGDTMDAAITSWGTFNASLASYSSGDACYDRATTGATITNTSASAGLANSPTGASYRVSTVSGEQVVASFVIKNDDATNPTGAVRLRIDCAGGYLNYGGTLGNMASATKTQTTGTAGEIRERVSRGFSFIELEYTANATETCGLKAGPNVATSGAKIHLLHATLTNDRQPSTMTFPITLSIPDIKSPVLTECDIVKNSSTSSTVSCISDENTGTSRVVLVPTNSVPSVAQIKLGQNSSGGSADAFASSTVAQYGISEIFNNLNPYADHYCFAQHTDASGNDSEVSACLNYVAGETSVTKSIKFDATHGYLRRGGALFTGTFDNFKLYNKDPLRYGQYHATDNPNGASLLAHAESVSVTSGVLTLTESDLTSGSINGLEAATNYWFYAFDNDKDPFAFGEIQITVE